MNMYQNMWIRKHWLKGAYPINENQQKHPLILCDHHACRVEPLQAMQSNGWCGQNRNQLWESLPLQQSTRSSPGHHRLHQKRWTERLGRSMELTAKPVGSVSRFSLPCSFHSKRYVWFSYGDGSGYKINVCVKISLALCWITPSFPSAGTKHLRQAKFDRDSFCLCIIHI